MKNLKFILAFTLLVSAMLCNAQTKKTPAKAVSKEKIEVYYFHFTARCVTCKTVEAEAKSDVETLYPELAKSGLISFQSLNLDDKSTDATAERLKVSGQTLLIVKGKKRADITNEGFLYARSNPEKFKEIIKAKIDGLK